MAITREEVEHIARLSRLSLTEAEIELFQRQLSDILDYAGRLAELDTRDIPPTTAVNAASTTLRADEPGEPLTREALLKNAPQRKNDQFRVPPVMEDNHDEPC